VHLKAFQCFVNVFLPLTLVYIQMFYMCFITQGPNSLMNIKNVSQCHLFKNVLLVWFDHTCGHNI